MIFAQPLKLLVVEDNLTNRRLVQRILEKAGCTVMLAEDGAQALALWQHEHFDGILMDISMPVMDGVEAAARIRELEAGSGKRTPIVALTAHALQGDREKYLGLGMDGYISKPINRSELLQTVAAVVAGK